jgi:hypothetical protein
MSLTHIIQKAQHGKCATPTSLYLHKYAEIKTKSSASPGYKMEARWVYPQVTSYDVQLLNK